MFGATGATGTALVAASLRRGHATRAFCRPEARWDAPVGAAIFRGRLHEAGDLMPALAGADAACLVFGPRPPYRDVFRARATEAIVAAMRAQGVRRLICQTGAMVGPEGSHRSLAMRLMAAMFRRQRPDLAADGAAQEEIVRESGLAWTIVKPPRLAGGPPTGRVRFGPELRVGLRSSIRRADLAEVILDLAEGAAHEGQAVYATGAR